MLEKQALGKSQHYLVGGKSEFGLEIGGFFFHVGVDSTVEFFEKYPPEGIGF